jgi:hypothetical protein
MSNKNTRYTKQTKAKQNIKRQRAHRQQCVGEVGACITYGSIKNINNLVENFGLKRLREVGAYITYGNKKNTNNVVGNLGP